MWRYRKAGGAVKDVATREGAEAVGYVAAFHLSQAVPGQVKGQLAAHAAGYAYDHFGQSPASSSSSYQQNGGAGGTRPDMVKPAFGKTSLRERRGGACPSGYGLQQVKTRWGKKYMCVLPKRERSKNFDAEIL